MTPMPPCPYAPKRARGAHDISAVIPETSENPLVLFCGRCGMTSRHALALPPPIDDMPADAIAQMIRA